ncbi:MAG: L-threonylcarbamoyladenylate synthase [Balneolaceae bacterium]|nr:L-threonylcarbamoyladenylate synthase [Balneolaceae bacterium]
MFISIEKAVEIIKNGEPVAFPTETVYGLGADAWNPDAIKRVFEIKGRPADNPLIVHIATSEQVKNFAADIPEAASILMEACWPGPLTMVFKKRPEVMDMVTAGLQTVAIRWPGHALAQELIFRAGPLVAPSANRSGRPSPTKAEHVTDDFGRDFPVVDGGTTQIGLESTVLDVTGKPLRIYRPGYLGKEKFEELTRLEVIHQQNMDDQEVRSPGTKYSHYSPNASVRWYRTEKMSPPADSSTMLLLHSTGIQHQPRNMIHYHGNYRKFANELYDRFRQADHRGIKEILVEPFSSALLQEEPLARALENRISKAIGE